MPLIITPAPKIVQPFPDLGKYCSYRDATHSNTASALGLVNTPTKEQYTCMQHVYAHAIVPIFDRFGQGRINSFFRSDVLQPLPGEHKRTASVNGVVGGSDTSNHIRGMAVDIDYDDVPGVDNIEVFDWVRENLPFWELICEKPRPVTNDPEWVHVATNVLSPNRKLIKRMIIVKGKKVYQLWPWEW